MKQLNITSFLNLILLHLGFWKSCWYFVYYGFSVYVFMCFVCVCVYGYVSLCMILFKLSFFWGGFFLKREKNIIWRCRVGQLGRWERSWKKCSRRNCNQNIPCDKNLFSILIVAFITQNTDSHSKEKQEDRETQANKIQFHIKYIHSLRCFWHPAPGFLCETYWRLDSNI